MKSDEELRRAAMAYHVQSPAKQAGNFLDLADYLANHGGVTFNNSLDDIIRPLVGGDLMMILGRTGHGKTTVALSIARSIADRINTGEIGDKNSIVVFASLEQSAEYVELMLSGSATFDSSELIRGNVHEDMYREWAVLRPNLPLWVIGETRKNAGKKYSEVYLESIVDAVESIIFEYGKRPAAIFVDYLQVARIREHNGMNRHTQVMEASAALKRLAVRFDVPVIYGSQAGQRVDDYKNKIPQLNDSMWASDASHLSDVVISIMRPSRYWNPENHPEVEINETHYANDDTAMVVTVLKQRFDRGFGQTGVSFIPQTLEMVDMETLDLNLVNSFVGTPASLFGDE